MADESIQALPDAAPVPGARTRAGVALVTAVAGTGLGFWLGGVVGAGSGLLFAGAARNTLRAARYWTDPDPVVRRDAGTSAGLALIGAVVAAGLGYQAYRSREGT